MTTRRTVTEAGATREESTLARRQNELARRESRDILDRLMVPPRPNVPPVLTEEQAAAGRLLRIHHAEAEGGIQTTFNGMDDRVDISREPSAWGPSGSAGSELSRNWLRLMEAALCATDVEIVKAIALRQQEPEQVYEMLRGAGFVHARREVTTHIRRAFEFLRRYCDGA